MTRNRLPYFVTPRQKKADLSVEGPKELTFRAYRFRCEHEALAQARYFANYHDEVTVDYRFKDGTFLRVATIKRRCASN